MILTQYVLLQASLTGEDIFSMAPQDVGRAALCKFSLLLIQKSSN